MAKISKKKIKEIILYLAEKLGGEIRGKKKFVGKQQNLLTLILNGAPVSLARNSAVAESEGGQKLVPCRDTGFLPPNPLPFCPPERSVWRAPARRSLGAGGKRAVNSVQNRFGFGRINAPQNFPARSPLCDDCDIKIWL